MTRSSRNYLCLAVAVVLVSLGACARTELITTDSTSALAGAAGHTGTNEPGGAAGQAGSAPIDTGGQAGQSTAGAAGSPAVAPVAWDITVLNANTYAQNLQPQRLAVADVDGDGKAEIFYGTAPLGAKSKPALVGMWRGADLSAPPVTILTVQKEDVISELLPGDFDGDGQADLVVFYGQNPCRLAFLHGDGKGAFAAPVISVPLTIPRTSRAAAGDLTGDGRLDVLIVDGTTDGSAVLAQGDGKGGFSFTSPHPLKGLTLGSVPTIATLPVSPTPVAGLGLTGALLLLRAEGGKLQELPLLALAGQVSAPVLRDADGDGLVDVLYLDYPHQVILGKGQKDGTFVSALKGTLDDVSLTLVTGDFNADGLVDIASPVASGDLWLSLASPSGFSVSKVAAKADGLGSIDGLAVGDVDGNGVDDVVVMRGEIRVFFAHKP
jgi:hypothetical protein